MQTAGMPFPACTHLVGNLQATLPALAQLEVPPLIAQKALALSFTLTAAVLATGRGCTEEGSSSCAKNAAARGGRG